MGLLESSCSRLLYQLQDNFLPFPSPATHAWAQCRNLYFACNGQQLLPYPHVILLLVLLLNPSPSPPATHSHTLTKDSNNGGSYGNIQLGKHTREGSEGTGRDQPSVRVGDAPPLSTPPPLKRLKLGTPGNSRLEAETDDSACVHVSVCPQET